MKPRALSDVARAVEGAREGGDVEVRSVSTDSRTVGAGGLFVALPGEPDEKTRKKILVDNPAKLYGWP